MYQLFFYLQINKLVYLILKKRRHESLNNVNNQTIAIEMADLCLFNFLVD